MIEQLRKNKLHMQDVGHGYGDKIILDNLDLSIGSGELVTLLGPSGAGKSTLFRLIIGEEFISKSGEILIDNNEVDFPNKKRGIVYQNYGLIPNKTVLENIFLSKVWSTPLYKIIFSRNWWKNELKKHTEEAMHLLEKVRLADAANKMPKELSGGMKQRVAIVQALMAKHDILLMDEPFGALDKSTRQDLQLYLLELWEEFKMTILFVTHDIHEAGFLGTRLVVLSQLYTDDRGKNYKRGAKIAHDVSLEEYLPKRRELGYNGYIPLIQPLLDEAELAGLNPTYLQHAKEFVLKGNNTFQTLTEDEYKPWWLKIFQKQKLNINI